MTKKLQTFIKIIKARKPLAEFSSGTLCGPPPTEKLCRYQGPLCEILVIVVAFWDIPPCSLVEVHRRFGGAYFLHRRPDKERKDAPMKCLSTSVCVPEGCQLQGAR
jgi:hypothetical protein